MLSKQEYCETTQNSRNTTSNPCPEAHDAVTSIQEILPRITGIHVERVSPLLVHAIYKCAVEQIDYRELPPAIKHPNLFEGLKGGLQSLAHRWQSAAAYLEIVRASERSIPP